MTAGRDSLHRPSVLHVIDSMDLGGAQTVLLNLARAWPRTAFPFEVAAMHGRGVFAKKFEALGVRFHSLSPQKFLPLYVPRLVRILRNGQFCVLHCHLFGANWIAKPIGALCRVPLRVSHDHCNDQLRHKRRFALTLDRITNRFAHEVIAVSESTRAFLANHERISERHLHLVHNGVDTEEFCTPSPDARRAARAHFGFSDSEFVVLGAGRFVPQKNFARWLRVFAGARRALPNLRGLLAGNGPEDQNLRAHAAQLGLEKSVHFAGLVEDRPLLYAAADILLITSDYEGLPMNLLEAMASGVPVVASSVDGLAEVLKHESSGLLVPLTEEAAFSTAVLRLATETELHKRIAMSALRIVREKFSARSMAEAILQIYHRHFAQISARSQDCKN